MPIMPIKGNTMNENKNLLSFYFKFPFHVRSFEKLYTYQKLNSNRGIKVINTSQVRSATKFEI